MNSTTSIQRATNATNPPLEAVFIVFSVFSYGVFHLPKIFSGLDSVADASVISAPLFEKVMSKYSLAYTRLAIGMFCVAVTIYRFRKKGHSIVVPYLKHSKLKRRPINLDGIRSQIMFTQWSFNLLTISFLLNGLITLSIAYKEEHNGQELEFLKPLVSKASLRCAILLFEIAAPVSMLVSSVTKYALWPRSLRGPHGSVNLRKPVSIIQHNFNVIVTVMEVGVLGHMPIRIEDAMIAPIYGCVYIVFMWALKDHLADNKEPQFVYFFFDTTLGKKWSVSVLLGLLSMLMFFYLVFTLLDDLLVFMDGGVRTNAITISALAAIFCRFRD